MASLFMPPPKAPKAKPPVDRRLIEMQQEKSKARINRERLRSGGGFQDTIFGARDGKTTLGS